MILGIFLLLILCVSCGDSIEEKLDEYFAEYQGERPGAAVLVLKQGEILYSGAFGMADMEEGHPVSETTNFRLASVSKQFTAMALLQIMDKGLLGFDTKLVEVFPELPQAYDSVDYYHILHHVSGIWAYEDLIPDTATVPVHDADVLSLLIPQDTLYFPPGTKYRYSNSGYALLALTIERLTGKTFPAYLQDNIFDPLGMKRTLAYVNGVNSIPDRALGYIVEEDVITANDQSMTSSVLGDGGIYSNLVDLKRWDEALSNDGLLSSAHMDSMFSPGMNGYACGWRIETYSGYVRHSHTGSTCGFRNVYQRYPATGLSIFILSNRRDPSVEPLAEMIAHQFLANSSP